MSIDRILRPVTSRARVRRMVSTSGSSGTALVGEIHVDLAVFDGDRVLLEPDFGVAVEHAGFTVEGPGVPGTEDVAFIDVAMAEGGVAVGAESVEGADGAVVVAEGDGLAAGFGLGER